MPSTDETLLCRYHYDPLDRLADLAPTAQTSTQRFYLKSRLTSEIVGSVQRSIFQHDDQLLAQQQRKDETSETTLLATDQQRSVLQMLDAAQPHPLAYTPYGHRPQGNGLLGLLGFNGEQADPVTGHYLLGNGYRGFNPVLMRFNSPDSLSPFGEGGLNAYTYCVGDPINRVDPTGHVGNLFKGILNLLKLRTPSARRLSPVSSLPSVSPDMPTQVSRPPFLQRYLEGNHDWHKNFNIPLSTESVPYDISFNSPGRVARYIEKYPGKTPIQKQAPNLADMARKKIPKTALDDLQKDTKVQLGLADSPAKIYSDFIKDFKKSGNPHEFLTLYRNENPNFYELPAKLRENIRKKDG
ncbi:RHS repeat-associated core domain-containing protein [Pseudomonas sp. Z1-14]|uniref:RHS repeat-associated core domain-containing protein n=1 Tax=Pseudomonas sp. Z1-14 TaxID=2817409 RepID=UPI003DA8E3E7